MGYVAPVLAARTRMWMGWVAAEAAIVLADAILPVKQNAVSVHSDRILGSVSF